MLRLAERTAVPAAAASAKRDFVRAVRATVTISRVVQRLGNQQVGQTESEQLLATLQAVDEQLRRASNRLGVPACESL